jgi:5-methylcytosine-specific restriction enzyme subunit McrC
MTVMLEPVDLGEWSHRDIADYGPPTASDRALVETLGGRDSRLDVRWLHDGTLHVQSKSWVGVVRFERVEIRIRPKYAGGDQGVLQMLDFASGVSAFRRLGGTRSLAVGARNLAELICLLLAEACEDIIRAGVLQDYIFREEPLPAVRGRLMVERQVRRHYGQIAELECSYDEYETDILENRILAAGLSVAGQICADPSIARSIRRLRAAFLEVCNPAGPEDLDAAIHRLEYGRKNAHYQPAHQWALLLLQRKYVEDLYVHGERTSFAFLLDMNVLFERFIARLLELSCRGRGIGVDIQRTRSSIIVDAATGRSYSTVRPDVVLRFASETIRAARPLDTKYKLYDGRKVDPSDTYQCLLYSYAFTDHTELSERRAVLLYPSTSTAERARVRVQTVGGGKGPSLAVVGYNLADGVARIAAGQETDPALVDVVMAE